MATLDVTLRVLLTLAAFAAFIALLVAIVRKARRGGRGMQAAAGAMLMMFSWGHMRDPRNDTVAEAQDGRIGTAESTGDPPA